MGGRGRLVRGRGGGRGHPFPVDQVVDLPGAVRDGGGEPAGGGDGRARARARAGVAEQRVVILVERPPPGSAGPPRWALLPGTPAAAALAASAGPLRWWRADAAAGTLTGFVAEGGAPGGAPPSAGMAGVAWRHAFGPGAILATAAPPSPTAAAAPAAAVVTGARALKLKPAPAGWAFALTADAGGRGLTASFFDGASGQAIFRQAHPGAAGPATAAWLGDGAGVAYTFSGPPPTWTVGGGAAAAPAAPILPPAARLPPRPWHLATIDIFDARRVRGVSAASLAAAAVGLPHRGAVGGGEEGGGGPAQSAWDPPAIEVDRATFALPARPVTLAATVTARGVAPTVLLVGTAGGEVLALPRRVVDPRRPPPGDAAAVAAGAAEGLPPYHPVLPAPPTSYATHGARLGGGGPAHRRPLLLAVAPAVLESTALAFGTGGAGDAWGSRLQPASSFDLPPPDFPYGLLAAVTALTGVGAALLKAAAGRARCGQSGSETGGKKKMEEIKKAHRTPSLPLPTTPFLFERSGRIECVPGKSQPAAHQDARHTVAQPSYPHQPQSPALLARHHQVKGGRPLGRAVREDGLHRGPGHGQHLTPQRACRRGQPRGLGPGRVVAGRQKKEERVRVCACVWWPLRPLQAFAPASPPFYFTSPNPPTHPPTHTHSSPHRPSRTPAEARARV